VPEGSSIKTIAELKGKKIGVPSFGSGGLTYGKAYVRAAGLDPDKDVTFIPIGSGSQAVGAVRQKIVDAVAFWNVANVRFELAGLKLRDLDIGEKFRALPDLSLIAKNDTIKNNPKMLIGFARAVSKAVDFTRANPEAAVYITWKVYPESRSKEADPQKALAEGLKIFQERSPSWTNPKTNGKNGLFLEDDWRNLSDFLLAGGQIAKSVPTSRIYTNDLIDQINNYDRNAVIQQAKNFDLGSVR
jgi:NitT/TauT family transport system substrate-binding protein